MTTQPEAELKEWPRGSGYWAYNEPVLKLLVAATTEDIKSNAGTKGFDIGDLGSPNSPTKIVIDTNEHADGDYRIYLVPALYPNSWHPTWTKRLAARGITDPKKQEYWINGSHLKEIMSDLTGIIVMTTTLDLSTMIASTKVEYK